MASRAEKVRGGGITYLEKSRGTGGTGGRCGTDAKRQGPSLHPLRPGA